jgi:lysophospholipase L1-like esterase
MLTRRTLVAGALAVGVAPLARAEEESWAQKWQRRMAEDWPGWKRYQADNARIMASGQRPTVVFIGDSITEGWQAQRPNFFSAGRVCRGVSGETTPQMVLRMIPDVCDLKPRFVHIMAGTNDIAGNTGAMTLKNTQDCYEAMWSIARAHDIHVLFASIPPATAFPWRPGLRTAEPIEALNIWLRAFAAKTGSTYVDYHTVLSDGRGDMKPEMASDGVHPIAAGYAAMETVIEPVLARLAKSKPRSKARKE